MVRHKMLLAVMAFSILLLPALACGGGSAASTHDWAGAWVVCKDFVRNSLKSPGSAEFPSASPSYVTHEGGGKYTVKAYVDALNSFGALMRADFTCVVEYTGSASQTYSLVNLDIQQR